jgi:hypothetical protein
MRGELQALRKNTWLSPSTQTRGYHLKLFIYGTHIHR